MTDNNNNMFVVVGDSIIIRSFVCLFIRQKHSRNFKIEYAKSRYKRDRGKDSRQKLIIRPPHNTFLNAERSKSLKKKKEFLN